MTLIKTAAELIAWRNDLNPELKVGFVPTMGALHQGHASLLEAAKKENDVLILSIYVNPTQFNDPNDLQKYPITLEKDLELASSIGVDSVFLPNFTQMYPDGYLYQIHEKELSRELCGATRLGHFEGMLTIVMKLLNLTRAHNAYFGEKDYQQLQLIRGMVGAFFLPVKIIAVPTKRETDGLAMSSRNVRLNAEERSVAPWLYQIIKTAKTNDEAKKALEEKGFKIDYIRDFQGRRFVAAFLGSVRLIDNVKI